MCHSLWWQLGSITEPSLASDTSWGVGFGVGIILKVGEGVVGFGVDIILKVGEDVVGMIQESSIVHGCPLNLV